MTCWRTFIAIKIKYVVRTFSSQKEFFVSAIINKIFMVKHGNYYEKAVKLCICLDFFLTLLSICYNKNFMLFEVLSYRIFVKSINERRVKIVREFRATV